MQLLFDSNQFERLFPFHLIMNRDLQIVHAGKSLKKLIDLPEHASFSSCFMLQRPQIAEEKFDTLLSSAK